MAVSISGVQLIALIPARSGSKRVKDKNIRFLGDIPLMAWSILSAHELNVPCYVSTDSEHYAYIAKQFDGVKVIMRPPDMATDEATDRDVIAHALETVSSDFIIYLRPTTPFRTKTLLEQAIQTMTEAGDRATSLRSVEEMTESAFKTFMIKYRYLTPIMFDMEWANKPNHLLPKTYRGNGYVDILKGPDWGDDVIGFVTPPVIEIDTERDFEYAEWWLAHKSYKEVVFK